ncbi:MAG: YggS family pyridoxal phosphate-dependent enzyme [Treponema sp.]|jgi:pyridoxal phosphate enzyme (YggS family)|nr:YggS family pyridoxal phosphate-dependent enzyme [Treponema sp.]
MSIAKNIEALEERIAQACLRCGRKREEITLMGVTKFQPVEAVDEAWKAGLRCFGESRVQEAAAKFEDFREQHPNTELHLIGALQRNKAKLAASLFDCIDCLDRESLAAELAKHTSARGSPLPLLLEFRTGEDSKSGFTGLDDIFKTVDFILACPSLSIRGLMTIAPNTSDEGVLRSAFRSLVKVRQELERRFPAESRDWSCLSMGMSGDFETAIEEGSTLLRIGSAIFGERI